MVEAHLNGVRNAMAAAWRVLERGGPALDAVSKIGLAKKIHVAKYDPADPKPAGL